MCRVECLACSHQGTFYLRSQNSAELITMSDFGLGVGPWVCCSWESLISSVDCGSQASNCCMSWQGSRVKQSVVKPSAAIQSVTQRLEFLVSGLLLMINCEVGLIIRTMFKHKMFTHRDIICSIGDIAGLPLHLFLQNGQGFIVPCSVPCGSHWRPAN